MTPRHLESRLHAALADTPVVLLHGARQSGKSTLAHALDAGRRRYLTLDDHTVLAAAVADPAGFIAGLDGPVVLDEVQRAPALFPAIKAAVDRRRTPGRFLLTGSANVLLLPQLSESLAGRIEILNLWPLSQGEIERRVENFIPTVFNGELPAALSSGRGSVATNLADRILRGGFPEPRERAAFDRRSAWFNAYLTTILQRDVRDLANIEGLTDLPRLLSLIASRSGGLLNAADLSRGVAIPQTTLRRYLTLLETTFLTTTIPAWSTNRGLRLTKSPRLYLCDTGLAAHLLAADVERLSADGYVRGILTESFVALELLKQATWSSPAVRVHHFRTAAGKEVDIVLEDPGGRIVGIEVKASATVASSDFRGLRELRETAGHKFVRGLVIYAGRQAIPFDATLAAVPIESL